MEQEFRMANIMGVIKDEDTSKPINHRKACIFEDESPVCNRFNRKACYDPDSLKKAFHPLGVFSKMFGLFPCYDFSFVENSATKDSRKVTLIHFLDYCYSAFIFILLIGGAILCYFIQPTLLKVTILHNGNMAIGFDYYIKLSLIITTIITGASSLFIFPMKWNGVLNFVRLISSIDKILKFDGRKEERCFAFNLLYTMIGCLIFTLSTYLILFVYDGKNMNPRVTDYLLAPIMALAIMGVVIPTGLALFFLNAIRLRMELFNRKLGNMLKTFIPSCSSCVSFYDYGHDLDGQQLDKQKLYDLHEDLEKMRILYCEIKTLGNCMSCIFGMHLVRDILFSMVALTLYAYFLLYCHQEGVGISVIYAGQGIFIILKIFVLVCFTQMICYQGVVLEGILQRVSIRRLPESCCLQLQAFLTAASNPPIISASGFFRVNNSLMTSIVASITTYFIILIQFRLNGQGYKSKTDGMDAPISTTTELSLSSLIPSI